MAKKKFKKKVRTTVVRSEPISPERLRLDALVEDLMGKDPSKRFAFIMANAKFVKKEDLDY